MTTTTTEGSDKPRVLILGGTGFIARHLVKHIIQNNLASKIRVVDKQLPQTAYLNEEFTQYYSNPIVEFKQSNLANPINAKKAFEGEKWNYVVNLAAETRYGQSEDIYKTMITSLSVNVAKEAKEHNPDKYIEVSTAQVYEAGKKASKEKDKLKPWTKLAKYKLQAEEEIKKLDTLNWMILRPAIVYGPSDLNGLAPRIICAATYTHTKQKMKLLWTGDLRIHTVHVTDVARAIWHLFTNGKKGDIYNLADKSDLTQGKLNDIFSDIYGIETGFYGSILSNLAQLKIQDAATEANETHMNPWSDMLKESSIKFSPLSPYIDVELLYNTPLSIDGTAIEATGFKYNIPSVTKDLIMEEIKYFQNMNLFPNFKKL